MLHETLLLFGAQNRNSGNEPSNKAHEIFHYQNHHSNSHVVSCLCTILTGMKTFASNPFLALKPSIKTRLMPNQDRNLCT